VRGVRRAVPNPRHMPPRSTRKPRTDKRGENTCLRAQCSKPKAPFLHPHTTTFTNIVHHITPHTSTANLPTSLFHPSPALFPCMVVWSEDGWVTTVATPRASMHASLPSQAVPPHDAEDTVEEEGEDEDEEETVSSTLVVVNPQELQPDDDDAASFQLMTPPLLPSQHDLGMGGSGSNSSNTFDPAMYMTGIWTPSHPQDWCDELEHGPDPVFVLGRQHGANLFAAISVPCADSNLGAKETKEGESKHRDGEDPDEVPAAATATEVTAVVITEPQGQAQEQPSQHCLDRRSTVAKLALVCWCLLAVLASLVCNQILAHESILPSW